MICIRKIVLFAWALGTGVAALAQVTMGIRNQSNQHWLVRAPEGSVDVDELRTRLRGQLSAYKVPRLVVVIPAETVPMMSSGKLDLRGRLCAFLADKCDAHGFALFRPPDRKLYPPGGP